MRFYLAHGVPKDDAEATRLFEQAADLGHVNATMRSAYALARALGTTLDMTRSVALYKTAAAWGSTLAVGNLGFMCHDGRGIPRDPDMGLHLYRRAMALGVVSAHLAREHAAAFGDRSIKAWDLCVYINLCRRGYRAGYLSEEEAWRHIMPAARLLQTTFDSWEDMGRNYLVGYRFRFFRDFHREEGARWMIFNRLLRDADSPWLRIPWDLDLAPPGA